MTNPYDIEAIFERLTTGNFTETDVKFLRDAIKSNTNQDVIQLDNEYAVNIGNATGPINLGDNIIYQGVDAETIREILRLLRDIDRRPSVVSNAEILRILQGRYHPLGFGRGRFYLPIMVLASWLIISLIISSLIYKYQPNSTAVILKTFLVFLGYGLQLYYVVIGVLLMVNYRVRTRLGFLLIAPIIVWILLNIYFVLLEYILISARILANVNFINSVLIVFASYTVLALLGFFLAGRFNETFTGMIDRWLFLSFSPLITVFRLHFYLLHFVYQIFLLGG